MPTKKKINYYYLNLEGEEGTVTETLEALYNAFQSRRENGNPFQVSLPGDRAMSLSTFSRYRDYAYHCCMFLKHNEFPEIIDNNDSSRIEIPEEFDEDKMLFEETHFVISFHADLEAVVVAVETVQKGVKSSEIENYFIQFAHRLGLAQRLRFEPVFTVSYADLLNRVGDVASIKMRATAADIDSMEGYDQNMAALFRSARDFASTEIVELDFIIKFNKVRHRHPTDGHNQLFRRIVDMLTNRPDARNCFSKLDVRATDRRYDGKLRLFDLIEEKVASEVVAERKRPTSKHFNSTLLYENIRQQIHRDFQIEAETET